MTIVEKLNIKNNLGKEDQDKDNNFKKKSDKSVTIEGLANPPTKNKWSVDKIKDTLEEMLPDLKNFGIATVYNIIIVYVIWKFGSHVIWFNSIPRTLLKAIYPPGYEYIKDILHENMKKKDCLNVIETGGMRQVKAEYFPDQIALFEERKSCCDNLELPYAPGSIIEMPCWPLSTDSDTVNRLDDMNYNYLVYNKDYTECIPYVQWMEQSKADAEQAKADAASAEAQEAQAEQAKRKAASGQSGGDIGSSIRSALGKAKAKAQEIGAARQDKANAKMLSSLDTERQMKQMTENQFTEGQKAIQKQIDALESANAPTAAQEISLATDITPPQVTKPLGAEIDTAQESINEPGAIGTGDAQQAIAEEGELGEADSLAISELAEKKGESVPILAQQLKAQQKASTDQVTKLEKASEKIARQQQKDDLKTEKQAAKTDLNLQMRFSKARIKMVESHQKNLVKLKEQIEKNSKMQNFKLAEKLRKQMNQASIKHQQQLVKIKMQEEKIENAMNDKERLKQQKQQMKNLKQLNKMNLQNQTDIDKANQESAKQKFASGAKAAGGVLKAIGKTLLYILTLLPRFMLGLAKWTVGCSWDQDWQGWVLGPNTANSLWASYTLAVKSSISWIIYNCLNMASGNIIMGFLICTVLLIIMVGLIQMAWVSPLSTVWTLLDFTWPPPIKWMSFLGLPILFAVNAAIFGLLCLFFSVYYVGGFWISCLFSRKGDKFKSQLRGCSNIQNNLRRLFFLLTLISAIQNLPAQVIVGMVIFLLFIEYKATK